MLNLVINSTDYSNRLLDALDNPIVIGLTVGNNTLEIRNEKPLSKLYFDVTSPSSGLVSFQYFDGSTLSSLSLDLDGTNNLKTQGWVNWTRASDDSKDGSYYRYVFTLANATTGAELTLKFAGVVFSQDRDLKKEYPNVMEYLPGQDTTFIRFHVAAKDSIVQWFRGKGKVTYANTEFRSIDEFDFLEPDELTIASRFMTLAKIFFWLSDSVDDKWYQKGKDFMAEAYNSLDVYYISLDSNRDAKKDQSESLSSMIRIIERG